MKSFYAIKVERVLKQPTHSKKADLLMYERKTSSYICIINIHDPDPLVMYTDDFKAAIYYSDQELKLVKEYLINNRIPYVITDVRSKKPIEDVTQVKRRTTSLLEFL